MSSQWYYASGDRTLGPISAEALQDLARKGELSGSDLVWREGMEDWVPASSVGLGLSAAAAPPRPNSNVSSSTANNPLDRRLAPTSQRRRSNSPTTQLLLVLGAILIAIVGLGGYWIGRGEQSAQVASKPANPEVPSREVSRSKPTVAAAAKLTPDKKTERGEQKLEEQPEAVAEAKAPVGPFIGSAKSANELDVTKDPLPTIPVPDSNKRSDAAAPATNSTPGSNPQPTSPSPTQQTQPDKPKSDSQRTLYQLVEFQRRPRFNIQGIETAQDIRYELSSRLDIDTQPDGTRKVVQYIQDTQLLQADDLSRDVFAKSLERLKNQQYTYTVNARGEVSEFTGHKDNLETIAATLPATQGFAVTSVIDKDGWKELAELTFLTPDPQSSAKTWRRQMSHDWGSMGTWNGMTTFRRKGTAKGIQEIEYEYYMKYAKSEGKENPFPFKITNANFEPQKSGGRLEYDVQKQYVRLAQEVFEVRGVLNADVLGQAIEVQLYEQQLIQIRVGEQRPHAQKQ